MKEKYNYYKYNIFQMLIIKTKRHVLTMKNNCCLNITFMNLLLGLFTIITPAT